MAAAIWDSGGSNSRRVLLDPERIRSTGSRLRKVRDVGEGRAAAECRTCGSRRTYALETLADDGPRCGRCYRGQVAA